MTQREALQLYYTSCRVGQSGNAGFQVRALSAGITPDEQREIERHGVYRPPRDAPEDADAEAIARDFPVALRFYTLESGRLALTRSCYSGRDYSGRWGNYFAHTLVFDKGSPPSLWPIDYYEWPHWCQSLEPAEDTEETPPPLPAIALGEVEPAESFTFEEISTFLREEPGRAELLARMGRAVLLSLEDSRAVVIRDTAINNPYWIASVQKLFPPLHAADLSTSSYQEDPRDCATVNATSGETDFTFGDPERRYQFYMFDLVGGLHSEVPEAVDYPAVAARWLAEDPTELERFFGFINLFKHGKVEPQLLSALHLFELYRRRDRHLEGEALAEMIRFAARWARPEGRVELMEVIAAAVERAGGLRRTEDYGGVIRFLAEGAAATGQARHRELTFSIWLQLLDDQVVGRDRGLETAQSCQRILESTLAAYSGEWARRLLETDRWRGWRGRLPRLAPDVLVFLLRLTWHGLELLQRRPIWEQPEVALLVQAVVDRSQQRSQLALMALEAIPAEAEALSAVSRLAAGEVPSGSRADSRSNRVAVGRALGQLLARTSPAVATATRRQLDDAAGWDVLFGEWLGLRDQAKDPRQAYRDYQQTVLATVPDYGKKCGSWVGESLLDHVSQSDGVSLALEWLTSGEAGSLSDELVRRCVVLANLAVELDPKNRRNEDTARRVAEAADHRQIELQPDRPALRRALAGVVKARSEAELGLDALSPALMGIAAADYDFFLAAFLRPALELTGAKNQHRRVLLALLRTEHAARFEKAYRDFFRKQRKSRWSESLQGALRMWLWLDVAQAADKPLAQFEKTAFSELERLLSRLSAQRYQAVSQRIRPRIERVSARWQTLETAVEQRKRGPLARLKGFLFRRSPA